MFIMNKRAGMTLLEVMIAAFLLAVCCAGVLGVIYQNMSTGQSIDRAYVSTNLAKNRIERLREIRRDKGYTAITSLAGTATETLDREGNSDSNGEYERTTNIQPDSSTNLTTVTVSVRYKMRGSFIPASTQLVTLISEHVD